MKLVACQQTDDLRFPHTWRIEGNPSHDENESAGSVLRKATARAAIVMEAVAVVLGACCVSARVAIGEVTRSSSCSSRSCRHGIVDPFPWGSFDAGVRGGLPGPSRRQRWLFRSASVLLCTVERTYRRRRSPLFFLSVV